ncbi:MAG: type II secretion system F family protein [Oxalicibacterium faecigallinarum]|uniref:type II secretion system F family protein n=1 Tax=Oxalicibacterium faecigallinarum TaxID=573741 RepID=UPI002809318B|nr:type II secretion system F family protein [Oxalicibacterium faecigallinarum]MDQ7968677.1 type II secretion system F family protein [Oxalicibacterium faecigallinarum]
MTVALLLASASLLLIGVAIFLWQNAERRIQQQTASKLIDQHTQVVQHRRADEERSLAAGGNSILNSKAWKHFLLRAGIKADSRFHSLLLLPAIVLGSFAALFLGPLSTVATLLLYAILCYFRIWFIAMRRHQKMVRQLPTFLDTMVRLATIGNSIESAFQSAVLTTAPPLRVLLDRANRQVQAGVNLEHALIQEARVFQLVELELIASVIGVALRFGGRADTVLARMSAFMRDREQAQNELVALSAETRLSAWILGLLPIGVGLFMLIFNDKIFMMMAADPVGRHLLIGAAILEVIGAFWLYRLAKSV